MTGQGLYLAIRGAELAASTALGALAGGGSTRRILHGYDRLHRREFADAFLLSRALQCRVVDLMDVLDGPDRETTGDLDLLTRMRTPGALELLAAYEKLPSDARSSLVTFLRTLAAEQAALAEAAAAARAEVVI